MTNHTEHLEFEVLNDLVDGRLDPGARARAMEHISSCAQCRELLDRMTDLLDLVESVPDTVLPPDDLWHDVRASIDQRKEVVLPVSSGGSTLPAGIVTPTGDTRSPWWARRGLLAAAAVLLMVASSGVTALVLRSSIGSTTGADVARANAPSDPSGARVLPASFRRAEGEYLRSIDELRSALRAQRSTLRPETIAAVEHSISIVDVAIEEARSALLNDPSNGTLVDLLTASYERKLDLLRRAADLDTRT